MELFAHYLTLPYLLRGISLTLQVTGLGLAGRDRLRDGAGGDAAWPVPALAGFARGYAVIFRGTPLILQMVFAYDALPHIGLRLSAVAAGGLALAANEAPFIAEVIRAAVRGVDRGQVAAGQALGMTPFVLMRRIISPQAIRSMVPALGNEAVTALKNSSLASVISVEELTLRSTQLASSTFDFFSIFFASGLLYLVSDRLDQRNPADCRGDAGPPSPAGEACASGHRRGSAGARRRCRPRGSRDPLRDRSRAARQAWR